MQPAGPVLVAAEGPPEAAVRPANLHHLGVRFGHLHERTDEPAGHALDFIAANHHQGAVGPLPTAAVPTPGALKADGTQLVREGTECDLVHVSGLTTADTVEVLVHTPPVD